MEPRRWVVVKGLYVKVPLYIKESIRAFNITMEILEWKKCLKLGIGSYTKLLV